MNTVATLAGRAWASMGKDPGRAREFAEEALSGARAEQDMAEWGRALVTLGALELRHGDRSQAERLLREAVDLLEAERDVQDISAEAQLLLLRCSFLNHDSEEALRRGHRAVAHAEETEDADLQSRALGGLAIVYGFMGAYTRALELFVEAVRLRADHGLEPIGGPHNGMGNIFLLQEEPTRALESFEQALAAYQREGNRQDEAIALGNVGRAFEALDQPERACHAHEQALSLVREHGIADYEAPALTKLGSARIGAGDLMEGVATLEEALAVTEKGSGAFRDETLRALADAYLRTGDHAAAEACAQEMAALAEATGNAQLERDANYALARIFEDRGSWRRALVHHKRYHELRLHHDRELFSSRTRALQMEHEVERSRREQTLLRAKNRELTVAYDELQDLHHALRTQADELERLSLEDPLTGLHNRRSLEQRASEERARIERYGGTYSVLVCDIDNFKETNDRFSHAVGDDVLEQVGAILRASTRDVDVAARFGGEEFVVLLPATTAEEASVVADKIRQAVESHTWKDIHTGLTVTISVGVAQAHDRERFEAVFAVADAQLYRAKDAGKNRVGVAAPGDAPG